jgi:hypothetical protein
LKSVIKLNPTTALVDDSSGNLVAWCIQHESGEIGLLQVDAKHRLMGLGRSVFLRQMLKMVECGKIVYGHVHDINAASVKLIESVGGVEWVGGHFLVRTS